MNEDSHRYIARLNDLKSARINYDSYWQEVADYSLPKRDFITTRQPGSKRIQKLYNSTAIHATEQLASALHGMLTPPAGRWFFMRMRGKKETADDRRWLDSASDYLFDIFSSPESSFATASHEMYLDIVAFGTGVMSSTFRNGRIYFHSESLANVYGDENEYGKTDTVYITKRYKPVEVIRRFGEDKVHENVRKAYQENEKETIEVLHVVEPRDQHYGRGAAKDKKPIKSCFVDVTNKHLMLEEGFDDMPFMFARWSKRAGEVYGYGCGMASLAEIKMLNELEEIMNRAAAKNVDPPTLSPTESLVLPLRLDPGGINFYDPTLGKPEFWQNGFQPNYFDALIEQKKALVQKMYYVDWLNLPQLDRMTTVEVNQRTQESLRQLSPMLSRLASEFLSPLINRTLFLAIDNGLIPKPPLSSQGSEVVIEYTSPIAIAQRAVQSQNVMQGLALSANLQQFDPSIPLHINASKIVRDQLLNTFAWPIDYMVDEDEVEEAKAAQAEQSALAQQAAVAESYSKSAKNTAGAISELQGGMI